MSATQITASQIQVGDVIRLDLDHGTDLTVLWVGAPQTVKLTRRSRKGGRIARRASMVHVLVRAHWGSEDYRLGANEAVWKMGA